MGGKGGAPKDTTQTTKPFPAQERALTRLFGLSQAAFDAGPDQFFPDSTVAAQSPNTLMSQQLGLDAAGSQAALGGAGAGALMAALDPGSAQSQALINPMIGNLQANILPSIGSRAIQQGAFGGDRQRIQEQQAAEGVAGAATEAILRNQMAALSGLPTAQRGLLAPASTVGQVGSQQQQYEQALINAAREKFSFEQQAPQTALDRLGSRISGVNLGQITNQSSSGGGGSNLPAIAGLGLAGYGLAKG
jgi:hypothetical protein